MLKICSNLDNRDTLFIINRKSEITTQRLDLVSEEEFLQVSCSRLEKNKSFKPHIHKEQKRETNITQEAWLVYSGSIEAVLYDIDKTIIKKIVLMSGDILITLRGGHSFSTLEDNTIVFEFKTGPYNGQYLDKTFI